MAFDSEHSSRNLNSALLKTYISIPISIFHHFVIFPPPSPSLISIVSRMVSDSEHSSRNLNLALSKTYISIPILIFYHFVISAPLVPTTSLFLSMIFHSKRTKNDHLFWIFLHLYCSRWKRSSRDFRQFAPNFQFESRLGEGGWETPTIRGDVFAHNFQSNEELSFEICSCNFSISKLNRFPFIGPHLGS